MRILDLFCGLKGWSGAFVERGHDVVTLDIEPRFQPDICADILKVETEEILSRISFASYDAILASPPCEGFSVMQIGRNWNKDHSPKTDKARTAQAIVVATLELIKTLQPKYFIIENPRAKLRKMPFMQMLERRTVTYCNYGERRMKPTDLWGHFPPSLQLAEACKNGAPCHDRAPRGSRTGTQGMDSAESAKIPYLLARAVCEAMEKDILTTEVAILPTQQSDIQPFFI